MQNKTWKIMVFILGITIIGAYFIFFYEQEGGGTIYKKNMLENYKEIVSKKEFDKLQVYVTCQNMQNGTEVKLKVEELGSKSLDVCGVLYDYGILTKDWMYKSIEEKKTDEAVAFLAKGDQVARKHIISNMTDKMATKYIPLLVTVSIK